MKDFMIKYGLDKDAALMQQWLYHWSSPDSMPIDRWLEPWYENKSKYLLKIFNNQTIIKSKVEIEASEGLIVREMENLIRSIEFVDIREKLIKLVEECFFKNGNKFKDSRRKNNFNEFRLASIFRNNIENMLIDSYTFVKNKISIIYEAQAYVYDTKKKIKITNGVKPFRLIQSLEKTLKPIAKKNNPDLFTEQFFQQLEENIEKTRLRHSQILNNKKTFGTLCLSIHPMDYMTMSDNGYNWTTCMAWQAPDGEAGCYHAGTVEMMNSPCVVVAYLEGKEEWKPLEQFNFDFTWSNKKWRELFVVDHDFITGIKAYPYHHSQLEIKVLNMLADLAENNLGYKYNRKIESYERSFILNERQVCFSTGLMYNDFGADDSNVIKAIEPNFQNFEIISTDSKKGTNWYHYSGPVHCTVCGDDIDNAEITTCDEHQVRPLIYCARCECREYADNIIWVNDKPYCQECYDNYFSHCSNCGEIVSNQETIKVFVRQKVDPKIFQTKMKKYYQQYKEHQDYLDRGIFTFPPSPPEDYKHTLVCALCQDCADLYKEETKIDIQDFPFDPEINGVIVPSKTILKTLTTYFIINDISCDNFINPLKEK